VGRTPTTRIANMMLNPDRLRQSKFGSATALRIVRARTAPRRRLMRLATGAACLMGYWRSDGLAKGRRGTRCTGAVPRLLPPFGATWSESLTPFSGRNSAPAACSASRSAVSVRGRNFSPPSTRLIVGSLALRMGFTRRDAGRSGCSARQARSFHVGVRSLPSADRIDRSAPLTPI